MSATSEHLRRLAILVRKGQITQDEFDQQKKLLFPDGQQQGGQPQQQQNGDPNQAGTQQAQAGAPEGTTAYAENASQPNQSKLPPAMAGMGSQVHQGAGGVDLRYIAQRAAAYIRTVSKDGGDEAKNQEIERLRTMNPTLHKYVIQLLNDSGSKTDPMKHKTPAGGSQMDPSRTV